MDKKKIIKYVTILGIVIAVVLLVWFIILNPLIDFHKKEKILTEAGEKYFDRNTVLRPDEGELSTVTLSTLLKQKYIISMRTTYGKKSCDVNKSWVKVRRKEGKYTYYTNLECGSMKSTIDNEGPVIKLKGKKEIEIEQGSKYTDEGIESVYDDTDGQMKTDSVKVSGTVDTSKIGTYKIEYKIVDSLENETKVERIVKVVQTLNAVIKKDTDKDNIYKGEVENNYIEFSNMLFRIVGINSDGTVKIVSNEAVGAVNYKDINKWLNEYFYNHLTEKAKKYIVEEEFCSSKIESNNTNNTTSCDTKTKQKVGILSIKDYNNSLKDKATYLYPINDEWTSDYENDKKGWSINTSGVYSSNSINDIYSLYPAINLKKGIKLKKGDGTKENPYEFSKITAGKPGELINTRYTGEYINYGETIYRIIEGNDNNNAKVIVESPINSLESHLADPGETVYNPKNNGNVGYYIENKVSKVIKTNIFVKRKIGVPIYTGVITYSGEKTVKNYSVKLAAPNMFEMFGGTSGNCWLINSSKNDKYNYMVDVLNNVVYKDNSQFKMAQIRFTGYIDKEVTILSGKGTRDNPYIVQK